MVEVLGHTGVAAGSTWFYNYICIVSKTLVNPIVVVTRSVQNPMPWISIHSSIRRSILPGHPNHPNPIHETKENKKKIQKISNPHDSQDSHVVFPSKMYFSSVNESKNLATNRPV